MNRIFSRVFPNPNQSVCASLELTRYPLRVQNYIRETIGTTEAFLGKGCIDSVILFGSTAQCQCEAISDVDLLIIVKNNITDERLKKLEPILKALEIKHEYDQYSTNWVTAILHVVEKTTGMFVSHFVCQREKWEKNEFSLVFNTNRLMTFFLAPEKLVFESMKDGAVALYGNALDSYKPVKTFSFMQLFKSLMMDLTISIGTLAILVLRRKNIKYALESFKWALRSGYTYMYKKTGRVHEIAKKFVQLGLNKIYMKKFLFLRHQLDANLDYQFAFLLPYYILKVHVLSFAYRKVLEKES